MEKRYSLYQSGVHYADIIFRSDGVSHVKLDVFENKWNQEQVLVVDENNSYATQFMIDVLSLDQRLSELQEKFKTNDSIVTTSWGALYLRSEEDDYVWCERKKKNPLDVVFVEGELVGFVVTGRESNVVLVKKGYEEYTPLRIWNEKIMSKDDYGVEFKGTFMVPMEDGVRLATDVWLPRGSTGKFPTILIRTPYGKGLYSKSHFKYVKRGYAVVIQDVRGREDSEGEWIPMHFELEDGDDSINWIASQNWCDGNVGMIGGSYGGFVQWAAAASGNPNLKAIISIVTAGSPFVDLPRKGGAFASGMLAWTFSVAEQKFKPENMNRDDWDKVVNMRPLAAIPEASLGKNVKFWDQWMEHEKNDEFWSKSNWHQYKDVINVPAMIVSGWFDDNGMGTTEALDVIADYHPEHKKVILGPWLHNSNSTRDSHGGKFGNNALRYDLDYQYLAWFDKHLKGMANGLEPEEAVEYYTTGDNTWRKSKNWIPDEVEYLPLFFTSDGKAHSALGNGRLMFEETDQESCDAFAYDPKNPAPYLIDMSENELQVPGNYKEADLREDTLAYSTPPLEEELTVVGDLYVEFYAASSARDTDWVVKITDVDTEGNSIKLADGVLRSKFRNGFDRIDLLEPGKIEKYVIRTSKMGNTFKKGHRIRLTITSSADNLIFPNSNTGEDFGFGTSFITANQKILSGGSYPSLVRLPVLKENQS